MFARQPYKEQEDWTTLKDPVATVKYDGAHYFLAVKDDGALTFHSRRPSVKGGFPERTEKLPHLTTKKFPELSGNVYSVELIHTGHKKENKESHPAVSGLLNSLAPKSIADQKEKGPIRAVLIDVINPPLPTYKDKLLHMKDVEKKIGKPDLVFVPEPAITKEAIVKLITKTKVHGHEGVIITSLTTPEATNPRIKIKHKNTYNLRVTKIQQEIDMHGKPKEQAGALIVEDAIGREVASVGTGLSRELKQEIWKNKGDWIGRLIQVETMGTVKEKGRLRAPVYNGDADGDIDLVE
jgi:hypothetical protein